MPPWRVSADRSFGPAAAPSPPVRCPGLLRDASPPPPSLPDSEVEEPEEPQHKLHAAVWLGDTQAVQAVLERRADVNAEDVHGVTPLMLAVELMERSEEYEQMVECLLSHGAQPRQRSGAGWSPLDEAVSRTDVKLVRTLFDAVQKDLRRRWDVRLASIAKSLCLLPDFECQIRWEFESPVIPLLSKIAPSDVILVRKRGSCLRLDSTLASWKRFRFSKRRNLTTLFIGERLSEGLDGMSSGTPRALFMINHDKEAIVDMTQSLDSEEVAAVVEDLVKADAVQWDMKIASLDVSESTTWLGSLLGPCELNGWTCMRYGVKGELGMTLRKKGWRIQDVTFQEYFGQPLPADACLPELRRKFAAAKEELAPEALKLSRAETDHGFGFADDDSEAGSVHSEVLDQWPQENAPLPVTVKVNAPVLTPQPPQPSRPLEARDRCGSSTHRVSGSVWLATDFPIDMEQFVPVLDTLAVEHSPMKRLKEILKSESLRAAAQRARSSVETWSRGPSRESEPENRGPRGLRTVFPVRASVPVNLAIRATMHVEAFTLNEGLPMNAFQLPAGYKEVPQSQVQKTASRAKKRMLIANLAL